MPVTESIKNKHTYIRWVHVEQEKTTPGNDEKKEGEKEKLQKIKFIFKCDFNVLKKLFQEQKSEQKKSERHTNRSV